MLHKGQVFTKEQLYENVWGCDYISDAYVKRYHLFMPWPTFLQKSRDVQRFIILAKACLTCNAYEELSKIKCIVFIIGGQWDKVVASNVFSQNASGESKTIKDTLKHFEIIEYKELFYKEG